MALSFKDYFIGTILLGLIVFGMIAFTLGVETNNQANQSIQSDVRVGNVTKGVNGSLNSLQETTNKQRRNFQEENNPVFGIGELIFSSIISSGKVFLTVIVSMYEIIFLFVVDSLGIPGIIFNVIASILVFVLILAVWRVYRSGE